MKEHDIPFTILGNPFHLNDEVCRRLKEYGCQKYQLSLDGMRETHDWFRKPGSFDITLEKIACIKKAGIRSVIMTTVSGTNIEELSVCSRGLCRGAENMMLAADSLGVGSCYIGQGWTAFADPYGQEVLRRWKIRTDYYAVMQLLLGYPREGDNHPEPKTRKDGRIVRV